MHVCSRRVRVVSLSSWLNMTARRSSNSSTPPSSSCVLIISSKRSISMRTRSTTRPSRVEVERMSAPQAEMSTAGVIIAVRTATAEENASIFSFACPDGAALIMRLAAGAGNRPGRRARYSIVHTRGGFRVYLFDRPPPTAAMALRVWKFFSDARESVGTHGRKLCYPPPQSRQTLARCTDNAGHDLACAWGHISSQRSRGQMSSVKDDSYHGTSGGDAEDGGDEAGGTHGGAAIG